MRIVLLTVVVTLGAALLGGLVACGGGGGGAPPPPPGGSVTSQTFNAAHSKGDLLTYTLDPSTLSYTYTRLEGTQIPPSGSGSLTALSGWGSYVYETDTGDTVVLLPSKLALVETAAGDLIAGVPQLQTMYTPSSIAGVYNYIRWDGDGRTFWLGTFQVNADGTWAADEGGNLASGSAPDSTGTWTDQGNGLLHAWINGLSAKAYNIMLQPAGNESLFVIDDLHENGMILGVRQRSLPGVSGTFDVLSTDADSLYSVSVNNGVVSGPEGTLTYDLNTPWTGFAWHSSDGSFNTGTGWHDFALMSPDGTFFGGGWDNNPDPGEDPEWVFAAIRR